MKTILITAISLCFLITGCFHFIKKNDTGALELKEVRLLHLGDMHAQLETHWEFLPEDPLNLKRMGGFARIKTALDEYNMSAPRAVFAVDGGDTFQGSALAAWTKGQAILGPLNELGIDVGIL